MNSIRQTPLSDTSKSETIFGRSWKGTIVAAAMISATVYAVLYFPDRDDGSGAMLGGVAAFVAAAIGFAAVKRTRVLPTRSLAAHAGLAAFALLLGVALGTANLLANYMLAQLDPRIGEWMLQRWAVASSWSMVVTAPIVEELTFRLFALSGAAWLANRFIRTRRYVFPVALIVSAILFGFLHILEPVPVTGTPAAVHTAGVLMKSTAAGILLGWIFWRWGLPNSIACHSAANATHIVLAPLLF